MPRKGVDLPINAMTLFLVALATLLALLMVIGWARSESVSRLASIVDIIPGG